LPNRFFFLLAPQSPNYELDVNAKDQQSWITVKLPDISNKVQLSDCEKTFDTHFISVKLPKCMYSQYITSSAKKSSPQYLVSKCNMKFIAKYHRYY